MKFHRTTQLLTVALWLAAFVSALADQPGNHLQKPRLSVPLGLSTIALLAAPEADAGLNDPEPCYPPKITSMSPYSALAPLNGLVAMSVTATGSPPLLYQWRTYRTATDFTDIPDATNATLVLSNVQPWINTKYYRVAISNHCGGVVSSPSFRISVILPPVITTQPTDQALGEGSTYQNSVVASNTQTAGYQWHFNGEPLAGKTSSTLSITNIQTPNAGEYFAVVSNLAGFATSRMATLRVVGPGTTFTRITNGPPATDLGSSFNGVWGDYDNDGHPDLFVGRYKAGRGTLYHNNGDGTFTSITNASFPLPQGALYTGAWADFDSDGRLDLMVAGENVPVYVFFNNGDGTFNQIQLPALNPWNICVADYDRDGLVDLFATAVSGTNALYRNLGHRAFQVMTVAEVGPIVAQGNFGGAVSGDYDDDGAPDIAVASMGDNKMLLFRNEGAGRFAGPVLWNINRALSGAWGDYDNDGRLDLCVASFQASAVYRNVGGGAFEMASVGISMTGKYNSATWVDYDNDGFLDLFMTYGNNTRNSLFRNQGDGTFITLTQIPIVTDQGFGGGLPTGGLWFDYDNDGFLDLYAFNGNDYGTAVAANFLYHNDGNSNAWLRLKLVGTVSNRDAIGAKVRVKATYARKSRWQRRDISAGDAINGNHLIAHFGLADATNADVVRIEWPSGIVQELRNVPAKQILTVAEPPPVHTAVIDGQCQLTFKSWQNQVFDILCANEVSGSLSDYALIGTVTNMTGGTVTFVDTAASRHTKRFYTVRPK